MVIFRKKLAVLLVTPFLLSTTSVKAENNNKKVRFIAVGDTGTGSQSQYDVAKAMKDKCDKSGCDFVIILGDNIYNSGVKSVDDPQFITKFENPYKDIDLNFYMTLGNHDYRGNVQAQIDYTDKSKKWTMLGRTYNFSYGDVDFFSLDTNNPTDKQISRLKRDIDRTTGKWKVAFGHHPRYTYGVYGHATGKLAELTEKTLCNKVDIYLSGHEHTKQHLKKNCGVEYLVIGTGAGLRFALSGDRTLFSRATLGFSWFEIDKDKMYFQILDTKGNVEYDYTIKK
ncbi:MAG: metallophosphoesterase [Candidatus Sericytochromatia bacterium]